MFTGELLDFQVASANKLCARKKELLALPQGFGKTVVSLASSEKLRELGLARHILILCPTGIAWQWLDKIKEFTDCEDVRYVKAEDKLSREYGAHQAIYTVIPYSVFRRDYKLLLEQQFDILIADEAQEFSNFRSKTYNIIKRFKYEYRWALTGTAISNKLEELYAIMQWVDPYFLPHWKKFEKLHLVRNPHTNQILKYKNLDSLNKYLLSKRVDRRTVEELQHKLPIVLTQKKYVEKDKEVEASERELYSVLAGYSGSNSHISWGSNFDADISRAMHKARQTIVASKTRAAQHRIESILQESDSNRVVVYSYYKEPLYELYSNLTGVACLFTGDQDNDAKASNIGLFKVGTARVLLCSNAGKAGLDLPFANYTIHLDVPFSYGISDQRSTRTRRVSSTHDSVVVIYLLVKDSIEEFYYGTMISKANLAKAALEGGVDKVTMRPQSLKDYLAQFYDH